MSIRLHLLFSVGFVLLLVIAAAGGMLHVTIAQTYAAQQIAVAARQETVAQQIPKTALLYARTKSPTDGAQLEAALASFDKSAKALLEGGDIFALDDAQAIGLGKRVVELALPVRTAAQKLLASQGADANAVDDLVRLSPELHEKSAQLTDRMFTVSKQTLTRLELIEGAVMTLGLLAGIVALEIGRRISTAVVRLTEKSEQISQGNVDLPIDVPGPAEIGSLGKSLDRMRISLKKSMELLQRRTA